MSDIKRKLLADVDKILSKASSVIGESELFIEKVKSFYDGKDNINLVLGSISTSYDSLRRKTIDLCTDVERFDMGQLKEFVNEEMVESFEHKKDWIVMKCTRVVSEEDLKEFNKMLEDLSKVYEDLEKRRSVLDSITKLGEEHKEIGMRSKELFEEIKKVLEE